VHTSNLLGAPEIAAKPDGQVPEVAGGETLQIVEEGMNDEVLSQRLQALIPPVAVAGLAMAAAAGVEVTAGATP
jgi:hypothetical protein